MENMTLIEEMIESVPNRTEKEMMCRGLDNIDQLMEIASGPLRFKSLDAIVLVHHLVEVGLKNNAGKIEIENGGIFILNLKSVKTAHLYEQGKKLGLKNKKLLDFVNSELKKLQKVAREILTKFEQLGLIEKNGSVH